MMDLVRLNVQGEFVVVSREILCIVPGTKLEAMFSGRWSNLPEDEEGRVFIDCDPTCFRHLLKYLSRKALETVDSPAEPPFVPPAETRDFECMLKELCFDVQATMGLKHSRFAGIHFAELVPSLLSKGDTISLDTDVGDGVFFLTLPDIDEDYCSPDISYGFSLFNLGYTSATRNVVWQCTFHQLPTEQLAAALDMHVFHSWCSVGIAGYQAPVHGAIPYPLEEFVEYEFRFGWSWDNTNPIRVKKSHDGYFESMIADGKNEVVVEEGTCTFGSPLQEGDIMLFKLDLAYDRITLYLVRTQHACTAEIRHHHCKWRASVALCLSPGYQISVGRADPLLLPESFL